MKVDIESDHIYRSKSLFNIDKKSNKKSNISKQVNVVFINHTKCINVHLSSSGVL